MTLYLDTSSAIKLYVLETGSDVVHALVGDAAVVATSAITYAETRAGLARLRREGALTAPKYTAAKREFEQQWASFMTLDATDALCRTAGELAERYRLRGFDSILSLPETRFRRILGCRRALETACGCQEGERS